jgi:hypothetical protein
MLSESSRAGTAIKWTRLVHQTVGKDSHACVVEVLLHEPQVGEAVLIFRERFASVYAPLRDVAGHVRQDTSVSSRHGQRIVQEKSLSSGCPLFSTFFLNQVRYLHRIPL